MKQGLIQAYIGKDSYSIYTIIGLILRATGHGFQSHIIHLKDSEVINIVDKVKASLNPYLTTDYANDLDDIIQLSIQKMSSNIPDIMVIPGLLNLIDNNENKVKALFKNRPPQMELVISGEELPQKYLSLMDLVTQVTILKKGDLPHIEIITGNGKGKTTYCLGKALFYSSSGLSSKICQFIKSPKRYGEVKAIEKIPNLDIESMGEGFVFSADSQNREKHVTAAKRALHRCKEELESGTFSLYVLDEVHVAISLGLIDQQEIWELWDLSNLKDTYLILSGRGAPASLKDRASIVIEMKEIKHPYQKGIGARKGIEY